MKAQIPAAKGAQTMHKETISIESVRKPYATITTRIGCLLLRFPPF